MKRGWIGVMLAGALAMPAAASHRGYSGGRVHYSGRSHSHSHGGFYAGGSGSSHKGGHYRNARTGNHYGCHKC